MRRAQVLLQTEKPQLRPWQRAAASWYVAARDHVIYQWMTEKPALTVAKRVGFQRLVGAAAVNPRPEQVWFVLHNGLEVSP